MIKGIVALIVGLLFFMVGTIALVEVSVTGPYRHISSLCGYTDACFAVFLVIAPVLYLLIVVIFLLSINLSYLGVLTLRMNFESGRRV